MPRNLCSLVSNPLIWTRHHVDECASTQDLVREHLSLSPAPNSLPCIRTDMQVVGRGRRGRVWDFQKGDLAFSFAVKPKRTINDWASLSLLIGLTLAEILDDNQDVTLKWPNDILRQGKKTAGILCEMHDDMMIIGIGVNLMPVQNNDRCHIETKMSPDGVVDAFLDRLAINLDEWNASGFPVFKDRWMNYALPIDHNISVKTGENIIAGKFYGVNDDGALLFRDQNNRIKTVTSGELVT